jgi:cell division septum initiation protein DivIVA
MDEIEKLKAENERLKAELAAANDQIKTTRAALRNAKDSSPVQRPSFKRVMHLVFEACMTLERVVGGWLLKLGHLTRQFRKLSDIWNLLNADDWSLAEIFEVPPKQKSKPVLRFPKRNPSLAPAYICATVAESLPFCDDS